MNRNTIKKIKDFEKIAAGEVIERPANVVKELIENSIDAGAKEIRVIIRKAGKELMQVIDDGSGIPTKELEIAFERHTSSKIRNFEDLEKLKSIGFRGEALASIAAVSKVEISSRTRNEQRGKKIVIEGGKIISSNPLACPEGTNIQVKNLFYNIPARKKFLKKDTTELGHITDIIQRYALCYPTIHFIYLNENMNILTCPASNDLKTTVFHIYGKKVAKSLEEIHYDDNDFQIKGLLGHSDISMKSRKQSSIFLNKRYVISDLIHRAIQDAYSGTLMIGKYPFFILYIDFDPAIIDFNVHPKKLHIRFEDDELVYNKIYEIVRKFVKKLFMEKEEKYLISELDQFVSQPKVNSSRPVNAVSATSRTLSKESNLNSTNDKVIKNKKAEIMETIKDPVQLKLDNKIGNIQIDRKEIPESYIREKYIIKKNFPKLRLISYTGQLSNNIYVVLEGINEEGEGGLYLLDQHAASERIMKEYFYNLYNKTRQKRQTLIIPLKIEVSPSQKYFLLSNLSEFRKLGFNFEHFGGNTFVLREIPTVIEKLPNANIIKEIIADVCEIGKDKSFSEVREQIINYLACHKSIRGGDDLSLKDIRNLLIDLSYCQDPYHCAHGRPTLKFISFKQLDKLFKRVV
ncbi:MAG: DNA mismatch repair endonuclease MutL [Promethearchaeota archaeon]|nr:MAG: DNA mismatch repair endonuclease MutL [Candidatus Lokiarchaeota archaeon]